MIKWAKRASRAEAVVDQGEGSVDSLVAEVVASTSMTLMTSSSELTSSPESRYMS